MYDMSLQHFIEINLNNNVQYDINYGWNSAKEEYDHKIEKADFRTMSGKMLQAQVLDWFIVSDGLVEIGIDFYDQ